MIISEQKTLNIDQNRIFFLSMGLHIQKKMNYHILEVYTVGSLQICSHNKDCNVQGRKITMLQSIYQKKALLQLILFLAGFQPHCYPQIPLSFRAEFFILPLFSLHIVSFQTNIHVPLINHHFRKLQAGRPGMKCWRVV